jgi:gas vesicle protein
VREREQNEAQFDLLTAALIGVAVGASATLLFSRGPKGVRPVVPIVKGAGRGAKWAGLATAGGARWLGEHGARGVKRGAEMAAEAGEDLWEQVPRDEIREYVESARGKINDAVEQELRELRRAVRRQRKRIGL